MRQRVFAAAAACLWCAAAIAAEKKPAFRALSFQEAEREAAAFNDYGAAPAMWVWTDKLVYQPGEQVTVRWTVKSNNDFYPYSIVAFRQNNQTGARAFLPGNSATVTDINGRGAAEGFQIVRLADASKATLATFSAPADEFGMHTAVVQLRDYAGGRVLKSAYYKFAVVRSTDDLPNSISENRTLTSDRAYRIRGIVAVRNNATLTIEPGTVIIGMPGSQPPSVLLITTAGKIAANGTRSRPIIMTSSQPTGRRQRGDWGGLILLGKAPINDPSGELTIEGLPETPETRYGGTDANHNCGSLRYVRVEFAGALLRPNEETNSFTWGGCGKATTAEYLQAHYGLDDSFEWFGGNNDARHLVGTYGADDYIDVQVGYTGRLQYVVAAANADLSNRGVEADNYERNFAARPLGKAQMWNMTFVGGGGARGFDEADSPCLYYRRGAGGITNNVICLGWTTRGLGGANFDSIAPNLDAGDFTANGLLFWDNGKESNRANTADAQIGADFLPFARGERGQGRNVTYADPLLARPLERSDPDFRPRPGSPAYTATAVAPPDDGFFDQSAAYLGAFGDHDWTEEWSTFLQEEDVQP